MINCCQASSHHPGAIIKNEEKSLTLKELLACVTFSKDDPWISSQHLLKVQVPRTHSKLTE